MANTNKGGRIERVAGFEVGRVMSQGFGGRRLPEALCKEDLGSASNLQFAFPQSAVGKDDRVQIVDTTVLPWRCVCHLVVEGLHSHQVLGTGWLAGPRTVITAGHNLFSPRTGLGATRVTAVPGRNGDAAPFNFFRSSKWAVHELWRGDGDERFDLGVIWLNASVGDHIGWFGYAARTDPDLEGLILNTSGYAADKRIGTQWFNAGRVSNVEPRTLEYGMDTEGGQSGSPVFAVLEEDDRVVLAVHAYGGDSVNQGIRITDDIYELLKSWIR